MTNNYSQSNNGNALLDIAIALLGIGSVFVGLMIVFSFLPWMGLIDCVIFSMAVMVALGGFVMFIDDTPRASQSGQADFLAQPRRQGQQQGLMFEIKSARFSLTLQTAPAMV